MPETITIAELAEAFDVTPRTLRFYESKGLLSPQRRGSTRLYSERDRVRLKLILRGKRLGFSLEEITNIIELYDPQKPNNSRQTLLLFSKIQEHRRELIGRMRDIEHTLRAMDEVERDCIDTLLHSTP